MPPLPSAGGPAEPFSVALMRRSLTREVDRKCGTEVMFTC